MLEIAPSQNGCKLPDVHLTAIIYKTLGLKTNSGSLIGLHVRREVFINKHHLTSLMSKILQLNKITLTVQSVKFLSMQ